MDAQTHHHRGSIQNENFRLCACKQHAAALTCGYLHDFAQQGFGFSTWRVRVVCTRGVFLILPLTRGRDWSPIPSPRTLRFTQLSTRLEGRLPGGACH